MLSEDIDWWSLRDLHRGPGMNAPKDAIAYPFAELKRLLVRVPEGLDAARTSRLLNIGVASPKAGLLSAGGWRP